MFFLATGSEEVGFLKEQLDSLCQDLDKEVTVPIQLVKERVKRCFDQSQVAFDKLRLEKQGVRVIEELTQKRQEIEDVANLEEQGII